MECTVGHARRTVFDTPIVSHFFRLVSRVGLKAFGWVIEGPAPALDKYVLIAAPHTSNWDFVLAMAIAFHLKIKLFWLGKASLFRGPCGFFMRWCGGLPVERSQSTGRVLQLAAAFGQHQKLVIAIAPEGTRKAVPQWKSGFLPPGTRGRCSSGAGLCRFPAPGRRYAHRLLADRGLQRRSRKDTGLLQLCIRKEPDLTGNRALPALMPAPRSGYTRPVCDSCQACSAETGPAARPGGQRPCQTLPDLASRYVSLAQQDPDSTRRLRPGRCPACAR